MWNVEESDLDFRAIKYTGACILPDDRDTGFCGRLRGDLTHAHIKKTGAGCIPGDVCIMPPLLKVIGPEYGFVKCGVIDLG
jgi:hypothetical protein